MQNLCISSVMRVHRACSAGGLAELAELKARCAAPRFPDRAPAKIGSVWKMEDFIASKEGFKT
jgi:hypothetical protein